MGAVTFPEAACEALVFLIEKIADAAMPDAESYLAAIKKQMQSVCARQGVDYQVFENLIIHLRVMSDWEERLRVVFGDWKRGAPGENRIRARIRDSGLWLVYFMDRQTQVDFFDVFREYRRKCLDPYVGRKDLPSLPELDEIGKYRDSYVKRIAKPDLCRILRNARLDERALKTAIAMVGLTSKEKFELKDIFDVK